MKWKKTEEPGWGVGQKHSRKKRHANVRKEEKTEQKEEKKKRTRR